MVTLLVSLGMTKIGLLLSSDRSLVGQGTILINLDYVCPVLDHRGWRTWVNGSRPVSAGDPDQVI